jgi:hypothetical protein
LNPGVPLRVPSGEVVDHESHSVPARS